MSAEESCCMRHHSLSGKRVPSQGLPGNGWSLPRPTREWMGKRRSSLRLISHPDTGRKRDLYSDLRWGVIKACWDTGYSSVPCHLLAQNWYRDSGMVGECTGLQRGPRALKTDVWDPRKLGEGPPLSYRPGTETQEGYLGQTLGEQKPRDK